MTTQMIKTEQNYQNSSQDQPLVDSNDLNQVLKILQKYNLKECEESLKKELNKKTGMTDEQRERDFVFDIYECLVRFVESTRENKYELGQLLFPVFLHLYLDMIKKDFSSLAHEFYEKFLPNQTSNHSIDLKQLRLINNREQFARSDLKDTYVGSKYNIKLSDDSYRLLKDFVKMKNSKQLVDLIKENIMLEIYNGPLRDIRHQTMAAGGVLGETNTNQNTANIFYGLLKEPELMLPEDNEDIDGDDTNEKPKKRKNRRDALLNKKNRADPNAPPPNRIPLPEPRDIDKLNRQQAFRDYIKRARLSAEKLPSICFYTILNSYNMVNCCDITDDSTWLALGLNDSTVRVCTLSEKNKLKLLKPLQELEILDKESDDIMNLIFDETSNADHRTLIGHSGPVYAVSFSPDKYYLLSGSEDGTIRLWCLLTYSCLVSYKGHNGPIWDVKFGPYGHYFASCGMDKTARLWSTDQYQSLKLYAEHLSDVECICFHPNSNYLATGSSDRTIRIFDLAVTTENAQVRYYTGHKDAINVLKFSACGRYLASGGADGLIIIWDISTSAMVAQFASHKKPVYALEFSRDNVVLVSGSLDNTIKLWNMSKLTKEVEQIEDFNKFVTKTESQYEIGSWMTKQTPIMHLHFTRRNLIVGIGSFISS